MPLAYYSLAAAEDFWTEHWGRQDPGELLAVAERSPLTELLVSRLPSHGLVLEAGCGLGQYVTYFRRRGYAAVGADWSARALATGRRFAPDTPLCAMDLRSLALRTHSVAAYVSLGVVEHDAEGPDAIVAEAARVLVPGGRLLLSVPYLNGVRRAASPWLRRDNARRRRAGATFYQFAFTRAEVRAFLARHGFAVEAFRPYDPARMLRATLRAARRWTSRPRVLAPRAEAVPRRARETSAGSARETSAGSAREEARASRGALAGAARGLLYSRPGLGLLGHMLLASAVKR